MKIKKRTLVKLAAGAGLIGGLPSLQSQAGAVIASGLPLPVAGEVVAISDRRFNESLSFAEALKAMGADVHVSNGDIVQSWYRHLRHQMYKDGHRRIALCGLTTATDFELMRQCLAESGQRQSFQLLFKGIHDSRDARGMDHRIDYLQTSIVRDDNSVPDRVSESIPTQKIPASLPWPQQLAWRLAALDPSSQKISDRIDALPLATGKRFRGVLVSWYFAR